MPTFRITLADRNTGKEHIERVIAVDDKAARACIDAEQYLVGTIDVVDANMPANPIAPDRGIDTTNAELRTLREQVRDLQDQLRLLGCAPIVTKPARTIARGVLLGVLATVGLAACAWGLNNWLLVLMRR